MQVVAILRTTKFATPGLTELRKQSRLVEHYRYKNRIQIIETFVYQLHPSESFDVESLEDVLTIQCDAILLPRPQCLLSVNTLEVVDKFKRARRSIVATESAIGQTHFDALNPDFERDLYDAITSSLIPFANAIPI